MPIDDPHSSSVREASGSQEPPWEAIAERIDAFAAAWDQSLADAAEPPPLDRFIRDLDAAAARQTLVELAKLDIERRWQHQRQPKPAEWYAAQYSQLGDKDALPVDLIYEEFQARMTAGHSIYQEEIHQRFPAQANSILRLLGGMAFSGSPTATYFADTIVEGKAPPRPRQTLAPFVNLKPGDQLDDFQLITPLGSGAFARVFLARQVSMERMVALKISKQEGSEPQTLAQLDHPHIVRVYDQRQSVDPPARLLYMEVVSGGTLQDVIAGARNTYDGKASGQLLLSLIDKRLNAVGTPIPESSSARDWIEDASWPEVVCRLGAELAEGLAYAHSRGVLHRDIKPANVLLSAEGRPKLADFNVSYNGGRADENPEDTFGGSLAYMSPEQLEACHPLLGSSPRDVREPSDVYALGVMLWELLSGRRPFRDEQLPEGGGGSLVRLQRMIETRRRTNFMQLGDQLPDGCPASVHEVLNKCLQADRTERYQTADELSRALRMCLNPRCWQLLQAPRGWLGKFVLKRPITATVLAGLIPNLLTARFNFLYNRERMVAESEELWKAFDSVQKWINGIAFPIGIAIGAWSAAKTMTLLSAQRKQDTLEGSTRVMMFGRVVAMLILSLWVISGIAFPIAIRMAHVGELSMEFYLHFVISLALCGLAATAYPYFLITFFSMRYSVPALVREGIIPGPLRRDLRRVSQANQVYLVMSALVPMLGVMLAVWFRDPDKNNTFQDTAVIIASGGGSLAFAAMYLLNRQIELDGAALAHISIDERRDGRGQRSSQGRSSADSRGSSAGR